MIDIARLQEMNEKDKKQIEDVARQANAMIAKLQGAIDARQQIIEELTGEDEDKEDGDDESDD